MQSFRIPHNMLCKMIPQRLIKIRLAGGEFDRAQSSAKRRRQRRTLEPEGDASKPQLNRRTPAIRLGKRPAVLQIVHVWPGMNVASCQLPSFPTPLNHISPGQNQAGSAKRSNNRNPAKQRRHVSLPLSSGVSYSLAPKDLETKLRS